MKTTKFRVHTAGRRGRAGGAALLAAAGILLTSCISFGDPVTGNIGTGPTLDTGVIAFADVTGRALFPDILVLGSDEKLWTLTRCPDDGCVERYDSVTPPATTRDLATGDVNGDRVADVVAVGDGGARVFFGGMEQPSRPAGLRNRDSLLLTGAPTDFVAVGDVTGDDEPDVVLGHPNTFAVYPGDGFGGFGAAQTHTPPAGYLTFTAGIDTGDFDGDGIGEVLWSVNYAFGSPLQVGQAVVAYGPGDVPTVSFDVRLLTAVMDGPLGIGDLNNDGRDDVVQGVFGSNAVRILTSSGTAFTHLTDLDLPTKPNTIAIADFDANGTTDLLVGRTDGLSFWHGKNNGTFVTVGGISRLDTTVTGAKSLAHATDHGSLLPNVVVSQGQPDGRVVLLPNVSQH